MNRSSAMNLICDIDGTSSALSNSTSSLLCWLERPDDSIESWMCNDLGSGERHFSSSEHRTAAKSLLRGDVLLMYVWVLEWVNGEDERNADAAKTDTLVWGFSAFMFR